MADTTRPEFDVVIFGATGFTGGLAAEYLARRLGARTGEQLRWAIAGRSRAKLEQVRERLVAIDPACERVGIVLADKRDYASLLLMARRTRVLATTVGPYIDGGADVVRACVAAPCDYVDITGEPEFVDDVLARFDDAARDAGVRIVTCCGFDSIPHDLGVYFTVGQLEADDEVRVEGFVRARGAASAGTWHSAVQAMSRLRDYRARRKERRRPHANGRDVRPLPARFRYDRGLRGWVFPLPTIDGQIVRRSARALDRYGRSFRYGHNGLSRSLPTVLIGAAGVGAMLALAQLGPTRQWLLDRKSAGDGPDEAQRNRGWFEVTFRATAGARTIHTRVSGGDPGYDETAKMLCEAALCLAEDRDRLPPHSGVLTPAVAMGEPLLQRLSGQGIRFERIEA